MVTNHRDMFENPRFYVLAASFLVSLGVVGWLRVDIVSDQLFFIRLGQVYGLLSILLWYKALIISPLSQVFGKERLRNLIYLRRAIGVSAAYFAVLHLGVTVWGQLGGISHLLLLPPLFRWSLLGGFIGVVVLLLMAATSFDKVIAFMTFRRWKWLHRLGYGALILVILHIWAIGTHVAYSGVQVTAFMALALLAALESYRIARVCADKYPDLSGGAYIVSMFLTIWLLWLVALFSLPAVITNYHQQRHAGNHAK